VFNSRFVTKIKFGDPVNFGMVIFLFPIAFAMEDERSAFI
jgi:hypothetical protein